MKGSKIEFYLRDLETYKIIEKYHTKYYLKKNLDEMEMQFLFRQFEEKTGMKLGKTEHFNEEYPQKIEELEKLVELHFSYNEHRIALVQYGQVRLLANLDGYNVMLLRPNKHPEWIVDDIKDEKLAKGVLIDTIKKHKLREILTS